MTPLHTGSLYVPSHLALAYPLTRPLAHAFTDEERARMVAAMEHEKAQAGRNGMTLADMDHRIAELKTRLQRLTPGDGIG